MSDVPRLSPPKSGDTGEPVSHAPNPRTARAPVSTRHRGPPLLVLAGVHAALFVASLALSTVQAGGTHFPSPFQSSAVSHAYFAAHADAVGLAALMQFGASVPLGIFTATIVSRLRFLGVEAAGVLIALFGGLAAAGGLASSALVQWVLAQPEIGTAGSEHALHLLAFAFGGPGYVVPFGLLVAGVAVTGGLHRLLPKWLMWSGLVLALIAELSTLSLRVPQASYLLPLARFPGFLWLAAAGALLPRARTRTRARIDARSQAHAL